MDKSIEWEIVENKQNLIIKEIKENINELKEENIKLNYKLDKILNNQLKILNLNVLDKPINDHKTETKDDQTDVPFESTLDMETNLDPYYINRMTNRLWRKSPYITTPNSFLTILNNNNTI